MQKLITIASVTLVSGATALLLVAALTFAPQEAQANPKFAQQTGKACTFCHTAPPALNDSGKKFKANGNKL